MIIYNRRTELQPIFLSCKLMLQIMLKNVLQTLDFITANPGT